MKYETLTLLTKFTPPGTPAPIRKSTSPSSLMKLSVSLDILRSMPPICPKCPTMRPATRQPPELPREKLIPGILKAPRMHPNAMARKNGKKPKGSIFFTSLLRVDAVAAFTATSFALSSSMLTFRILGMICTKNTTPRTP